MLGDLVSGRGIDEVVHFTISHGCLGTLLTGMCQSRARLQDDEMVKYLFSPNSALRKDIAYLDYVSLSLNHINARFYRTSAHSWHREKPIFWCILSFDPVILTHPNVEFATTNNMYTGVRRGVGVPGFEALFAPVVTQYKSVMVRRGDGLHPRWTTCQQAEALYPGAVSTEYLRCIYVQTLQDQSEVIGFIKATVHRDIEVRIAPEKFGERVL